MSRLAVLDTPFGLAGQIKRKTWLIILLSVVVLFGIFSVSISNNPTQIIARPAVINIRPVPAAALINKQLQKIKNQPITIHLHGQNIRVSSKTILSWVKAYQSTGQIVPDTNAITSYLQQLTSQYSVESTARITMNQPGKPNLILAPGSSGYRFGSVQAAASQIQKNLLSGGGSNVNLPGAVVSPKSLKVENLNKLIDVNLQTKRMYVYQDGKLVKSFLVTAGAPLTPTPTGEFKIWEKLRVQEMKAYYPNGALEYDVPNVRWVNYFTHAGNAIHGNYWRPLSVFGNLNTSHGCISVVNSDAKWIYDWAPIGTTVTVHN